MIFFSIFAPKEHAMTSHKLRFAIFGNSYQPGELQSVQRLLTCLTQQQAEVLVEREFYTFITSRQQLALDGVTVFEETNFDADFVVSMGGDGTFLRAASLVGSKQTPILGINTGRLGFLADVNVQEIEHTITALYKGDYAIDTRSVLQVRTDGEQLAGYNCALNDIAILKHDTASMIAIHTTINGEFLTTYQADGLIISTPTGSTAYSLSNGGPIMVPGTHVFSLTAVAPHSLNARPIVIAEESEIQLTIESRTHNFLVALDGRSVNLSDSTRLTLAKAPYRVRVIKRAGTKYFNTLREKMMWGADQRL